MFERATMTDSMLQEEREAPTLEATTDTVVEAPSNATAEQAPRGDTGDDTTQKEAQLQVCKWLIKALELYCLMGTCLESAFEV